MFYKDAKSKVHELSEYDITNGGEQLLPPGCVRISADEASQLLSPTDADKWAAFQADAKVALDQSDVTMIRCVENGVTVPATWSTYRAALRAIVGASSGDASQKLPKRPAYPSGT